MNGHVSMTLKVRALPNFKSPSTRVHTRQHSIQGTLSGIRNGPLVTRMGYILHSSGSLTKNKATPAHGKLIWNKSRPNFSKDKQQSQCGALFPCLLYPQRFGISALKIELNGQLSETGHSKIYRDTYKLLCTYTCENPADKEMDAHRQCSQKALFDGLIGPEPFKQPV